MVPDKDRGPGAHDADDQDDGAGAVHDVAAGAERYYGIEEEAAMDYAAAVNEEIRSISARRVSI